VAAEMGAEAGLDWDVYQQFVSFVRN